MRRWTLSMLSAAVCWGFAAGGNAQDVTVAFPVGDNWGQAVTAYGDYLRWMGEARLRYAQALREEALAAQDLVRANILNLQYRSLLNQSRRIERRISRLSKLEVKVMRFSRTLDTMLNGAVNPYVVGAINFFLRILPIELFGEAEPGSDTELAPKSASQLQIPALSASEFEFLNPTRTRWLRESNTFESYTVELSDFAGGSLTDFVSWMAGHRLKAIPGTEAAKQLIIVRNKLAKDSAEQALERLRKLRESAEMSTGLSTGNRSEGLY